MGLFRKEKRQQGDGAGRPGTGPLGSGRRLRSDLSPRDCADFLMGSARHPAA